MIRRLTALTIGAALVLAACGGDDDDSTSPVPDVTSSSTDSTAATDDTTTATTEGVSSDATTVDAAANAYSPGDTIPGDEATGKPEVVLPSSEPTELVVTDLVEGTGDPLEVGDTVVTHYVGVLSADGTEFDESYSGDPIELTVGSGQVIPGWDQGLIGVKAGGRRQIDIPASLAYGAAGAGGVIPPNASLTFVVDVVEVIPPPPPPTLAPMADADDCPAADGSSEKQQEFDEYPPTCIDVTKTYTNKFVE